jgi:flagellar biosynthesis protein FliR
MLLYDVTSLVVVTTRCFGALVVLPCGEFTSLGPKLFLALVFAAAIQPPLGGEAALSVVTLVRELFVGLALGLPCRLAVEAVELLGEVLDAARGQTISSIVDPIHGQLFSDLSAVLRMACIAAALHSGGLLFGCLTLRRSYEAIPVSNTLAASKIVVDALPRLVLLIGDVLLFTGVWLGGFLLVDLVAALCARVCPGLSFSTLSHLVKFLVLVAIAAVGGTL